MATLAGRSKVPCDVFDPWVCWERVRLGSENSSGAGVGAGAVWKSGNQNWSEMGPYGSIWLDTAAKMIVRTLRIFFVFKKSLKICLGVPKKGP